MLSPSSSDCSLRRSTTSDAVERYDFGNTRLTAVATTTVTASTARKTVRRARSAAQNNAAFTSGPPWRSKHAGLDADHVVRLDAVAKIRIELERRAVRALAVNREAALGAARRQAAAERQRAHHRRSGLERIRAGALHGAIYIEDRGARDEDRVAGRELDVRGDRK